MTRFGVFFAAVLIGACSSNPVEVAPDATTTTTSIPTKVTLDVEPNPVETTAPSAAGESQPGPVANPAPASSPGEPPTADEPSLSGSETEPSEPNVEFDVDELEELIADLDGFLVDLAGDLVEDAWDEAGEEAWKDFWEQGGNSNG